MEIKSDIEIVPSFFELLEERLLKLEQAHILLQADYACLKTENNALKTENTSLKAQNFELLSRLNQNSKNSHKPPSSEGLRKGSVLQNLTKSVKPTGGQKGHQGKTLLKVTSPDEIIVHHASCCCGCGQVLDKSHVIKTEQSRQVFDLPEPRLHVTEHQRGISQCPCGAITQADFPPQVPWSIQYGNRIKSLSVLLNVDYRVPLSRIELLFSDLYGCSFNESTAISANQVCFENLQEVEQDIKKALLQSDVAHADETGIRVEGKLHWLHTFCTGLYTFLFVHPNRGEIAINSDQSLVKDFKNWLIHDCWASYFSFNECHHGICNAHLVRELEALIQSQSIWAAQCQDYLIQLYLFTDKGRNTIDDPIQKQEWLDKYHKICQIAHQEEPPPIKGSRGKPKNSKGRNLLNRLTKHIDAVLAFAFVQYVPFTNNQAERDIRGVKVKQKVSNGFRTINGANHYARIQGFISTMRKHNKNIFNELAKVFNLQFAF